MIGNVWEWTGDKFGRYHDHEPDTDPSGSPRGQDYVKKGGSFLSDVDHSYRNYFKIYMQQIASKMRFNRQYSYRVQGNSIYENDFNQNY